MKNRLEFASEHILSCYLSEENAAAISIELLLTINSENQTISGIVTLKDNSNTLSKKLHSQIHGNYSQTTLTYNKNRILVMADGFEGVLENMKLKLLMENDWSKGFADFGYTFDGYQWLQINKLSIRKS